MFHRAVYIVNIIYVAVCINFFFFTWETLFKHFQILSHLFLQLNCIYQSQLAGVRQRHGSHAVYTRNRFRIRRDHILEDAYSQMNQMNEEDLRGPVNTIIFLSLVCNMF